MNSHLETPEFPLNETEGGDGPGPRMAHEIGCGAVVIRTTADGPVVCLKLDRIGKEYIHHYLIPLHPRPSVNLELIYIDPEDMLFDCFATMDISYGDALPGQTIPEAGQAFENDKGFFIKALDDPQTQKMFGFVDPATGLVCIRQERKIKAIHPDWDAKAKIGDEVIEFSELLKRFEGQL